VRQLVGRKRTSAALGALLALAVVGGVFAYWTQSGSGSGTAKAGTTTPVTVNQTSTVTGLYPGGSAVTLSGDFNNPNPGAVKVGDVSVVVDPAWSSGTCTDADFVIGGSASVNAEIPAGNGVGAWTGLTIRMANHSTNQDDCKGVTADLLYTVTAAP
jgi:predicted ribosomally synthesized peptide with SipW-like signal peptide